MFNFQNFFLLSESVSSRVDGRKKFKVTNVSKTVKVKSVLPGSPAELCRKIVSGDELLSVCE